jgi:anti-sigma B factor antagonist
MIQYERVQVDEASSFTLVRFSKPQIREFDEIEELGTELYAMVAADKSARFVFDFSTVTFLGSAALGKLISLFGRIRARQGTMVLCGLNPHLLEVFHSCHLDRIFHIRGNVEEVLAAWTRPEG